MIQQVKLSHATQTFHLITFHALAALLHFYCIQFPGNCLGKQRDIVKSLGPIHTEHIRRKLVPLAPDISWPALVLLLPFGKMEKNGSRGMGLIQSAFACMNLSIPAWKSEQEYFYSKYLFIEPAI